MFRLQEDIQVVIFTCRVEDSSGQDFWLLCYNREDWSKGDLFSFVWQSLMMLVVDFNTALIMLFEDRLEAIEG
jgi:hypothetical protein